MGKRIGKHRLQSPKLVGCLVTFPSLDLLPLFLHGFHVVGELLSFHQGEGKWMCILSQEKICFREDGVIRRKWVNFRDTRKAFLLLELLTPPPCVKCLTHGGKLPKVEISERKTDIINLYFLF